jgi:ribose-phosphate pyrophosphokinase
MRTYLLPEPTPFERNLMKRLSGSAKAPADWTVFGNGEAFVRVRDVPKTVAVVGWIAPPYDDLTRTALLVDTLRRSGAKDITLILPYLAYERQDRQIEPGDAFSSACVTTLMAAAGATRILTVDLHSKAAGEASPIPVESVSLLPEMGQKLRRMIGRGDVDVISPDHGGIERAKAFAAAFGAEREPVWIEKERKPSGAKAKALHGGLKSTVAVIVDDILDSGKTVFEAARLARKAGALVKRCDFEEIIVSDTMSLSEEAEKLPNLTLLSAVPALAAAALLLEAG